MKVEQTRVHPEPGAELVRGVRHITLKYRSQEQEIELPGWYPIDDPTADQGLHDAKDMKVSDLAVNTMKARGLSTSIVQCETQMKSDQHNLTDADLEELIADSNFLTCLIEMQVHTWEGYEAAWEMFNNMEDVNNDK